MLHHDDPHIVIVNDHVKMFFLRKKKKHGCVLKVFYSTDCKFIHMSPIVFFNMSDAYIYNNTGGNSQFESLFLLYTNEAKK